MEDENKRTELGVRGDSTHVKSKGSWDVDIKGNVDHWSQVCTSRASLV